MLSEDNRYRVKVSLRREVFFSAFPSLPSLSLAQVRLVESAWESFLAVSAAWKPLPKVWGSRFHNKRLLELQKLARWLVKSCCRQGVGATLAWLKKAAAGCRDAAITGAPLLPGSRFLVRKLLIGCVSKDALDQVAFLGRSLPPGDDRVAARQMIAHRSALTTVRQVDSSLAASARRFASWFAQRHIREADLSETVSPTPSASRLTTRKAGGAREEVRKRHRNWIANTPSGLWARPDALTFLDYREPFLTSSEVDSVRSNQGSVDVARSAAYLTATEELPNRVTCVRERGFKVRIVSAPEGFATISGSCLNKALLRGVSRYGPCSSFLRGDRRKAVEEVCSASRSGDFFVSTDLTAATDRLPLDLVKSVVLGLIDGWKGLPPVWAEALLALTGPQSLSYPWGQRVMSTCGILMGLGPSWPILSIIHAWWAETSWRMAGWDPRRQLGCHAIGGDDLFARWPWQVVDRYRSIVSLCGGERSSGKDFLSVTAGNFTEMSIFAKFEGSNQFRWSRAIPVKGLVGASVDEIGASYESLGSDPGRTLAGRRVIAALRPESWKLCRDVRISPCIPRSLGGAGLPPRTGSVNRIDCPLRHRLALGRFLYGSGNLTVPLGPPSWVEAGDPTVWESRVNAEQRLEASLEIGLLRYTKEPRSEESPAKFKAVVTHLSDQMAYFARARVFSDNAFPPVATEIVSLKKYSRLVNGWISKKTGEGLPSRMAIRNRVNSRMRLLARARQNRQSWHLELLLEGPTGNHRPIL